MPNIQSAKKKLRQDTKRTKQNDAHRKAVKQTVKKMGKMKSTLESIKKAFSLIDKAAKKGAIHKNKAARLKSKISRAKK